MAQVINTNVASLNAQRHLNASQGDQEVALERLSSGLRINSARDDAAGLAISERFTGQVNGMNQAARNANDGISFAQTAEGAMEEMSNLLQRIRELAVQSVNDTNSPSDRRALDQEVQQAVAEVQRIAESTQFNQQNVLDGTLRDLVFQVGANRGQTINASGVDVRTQNLGAEVIDGLASQREMGSDPRDVVPEELFVNGQRIAFEGARDLNDVARELNEMQSVTGVTAERADQARSQPVDIDLPAEGDVGRVRINGHVIELDGDRIETEDDLARAVNDQVSETGVRLEQLDNDSWSFTSNEDFEVEYEGDGGIAIGGQVVGSSQDDNEDTTGMIIERGISLATEVGNELRVYDNADGSVDTDGDLALTGLSEVGSGEPLEQREYTIGGSQTVDVRTRETASDTIVATDYALQQINNTRAELGAVQNRFDATINNLNISSENMEASRSRILDADFAEETAEMTRTQILQQAGTSVLGQANEIPQQVVQLLQQ